MFIFSFSFYSLCCCVSVRKRLPVMYNPTQKEPNQPNEIIKEIYTDMYTL